MLKSTVLLICAATAAAGAESIELLDGGSFRIGGVELHLAGGNSRAAAIAQFSEVCYRDVYPGIDLHFHGHEYDFVIAPHADARRIRLEFRGAHPHLEHGDLVVPTFRQLRPQAYQIVNGQRHEVAADFVLSGNAVRFRLGAYDRRAALLIDPVIVFATYLGLPGNDAGNSIAVDSAGNIYVAGTASSGVFVTKLSNDGTAALYSIVLGAAGSSVAGMVVDAAGNAYVTGTGVFQSSPGPGFIAKLSPTGGLLYSASIAAMPTAIAVDAAGAAYVTGSATGAFTPTAGAFQTIAMPQQCPIDDPPPAPCANAFVLKLLPDGSAPAYATFLGGLGPDAGKAIAVDASGNAVVAGMTASTNFPVTPSALQGTFGGGYTLGPEVYGDAFVTKLNAAGSALIFSTYLGGANVDYATALALDPAGNVYVNGYTQSVGFPTTPGAYESSYPTPQQTNIFGPPATGFVTKLDPTGRLVYSTFIGSTLAIDVDGAGYAYLEAAIPPRPSTVPYSYPAVAILNPAGSAIVNAGGAGVGASGSSAMAIDGKGFVYQTGSDAIGTFFGTPGSLNPNPPGSGGNAYAIKISLAGSAAQPTIFTAVNSATEWPGPYSPSALATFAPGEVVTIYGALLGPATGAAAPAGATVPTLLGGTRVLFDGTPAPLLWVGSDQVNAIVPFEVKGPSTAMSVEVGGTTYGPWTVPVAATVPGIFTLNGSGGGQAAVLNQDGTLNSASNPAAKGSVISIYATGAGLMNTSLTDGSVISTSPPFPMPLLPVLVEIGGVGATLQYAGAAPGLVAGTFQVNVYVPQGAPSGAAVPLLLAVGSNSSLPGGATVAIQ